MKLSLLTNLYEFAERDSAIFNKNKYGIDLQLRFLLFNQKEYSKVLQFLFYLIYFYSTSCNKMYFKNKILSTGIAKKEQVHKSSLNIFSVMNKKISFFDFKFINLVNIFNIIFMNFYNTNTKYFFAKARIFKNCSFLYFTKIKNISNIKSLNKAALSRMSCSLKLNNSFMANISNSIFDINNR